MSAVPSGLLSSTTRMSASGSGRTRAAEELDDVLRLLVGRSHDERTHEGKIYLANGPQVAILDSRASAGEGDSLDVRARRRIEGAEPERADPETGPWPRRGARRRTSWSPAPRAGSVRTSCGHLPGKPPAVASGASCPGAATRRCSRCRPADRSGRRRRTRPGGGRRLFDGSARASVFHAAAVIHPASSRARAVRRERRRHAAGARPGPPRRARRASCTCRRTRRSARTRRPRIGSPRTRRSHPYLAYGRSKLEAEQLVQRSYDRGDLATVIVRPPWFYGPFQPRTSDAVLRRGPPRPVPARRRRARSGDRWSTPATSCRACCCAEVADAAPGHARTGSPTPSPTSCATMLQTVRDALEAEGLARVAPAPAAACRGPRASWPRSSTRSPRPAGATCRPCTCSAS